MISGNTFGIRTDFDHNLSKRHIGDVLESHGYSWKTYQEDYPDNEMCFTDSVINRYARKHNPFMSFTYVSQNVDKCQSHIVNANQLWTDLQNNELPNYVFYTPNLDNDGHDTFISYTSNWLRQFMNRLHSFELNDTLVISPIYLI